jgi:hypothetical protein
MRMRSVLTLAVMLSFGLVAHGQPIVDTTPPEITGVIANPGFLWPPNHKMREVQISAVVVDDTDLAPTFEIIEVTSDEPVDDPTDTDAVITTPDWEIIGDDLVNLRAERMADGDGRTYTVTIEASDADGNTSTETVEVVVPHDMGHKNAFKEAWKLQKKEYKLEQKAAKQAAKEARKLLRQGGGSD